MKRERERELLLNGFIVEVKDILKNFDEVINSTLGDTVTITSATGDVTRAATLQDKIDLYQNEWCNTVALLDEIGVNCL